MSLFGKLMGYGFGALGLVGLFFTFSMFVFHGLCQEMLVLAGVTGVVLWLSHSILRVNP